MNEHNNSKIQCSVYPSNLVEPVKINSKYIITDKNLNKPFQDEKFYEELEEFNREMLRELDNQKNNYFSKKDKSFENLDYFQRVYAKKPKQLYENDGKYYEANFVRPLIPQRSFFLSELNKK